MSKVEDTRGRERLDEDGYAALRRETSTYREQLVVRLAGEVGLRPGEMTRLRPRDVNARILDGAVHYLLAVTDSDGAVARDAYLPADVERELDRYARSNGLDADDPVFGVSPRRLQMLVSEVAERAAEATGDRSLADVSSSDLRRLFARRHLREGVPPSVVMAVGGWRRLDSLTDDDPDPGQARIAAAFDGASSGGDQRFRAAFDRLEGPAALLDASGVIEHVNRRFESVLGLDRSDALGRELRDLAHSVEEREYAAMWEAVVAGERWSGEVATTVPDGDSIRGRLTLAAIGSGPRPDGFVATFRSHEEGSEGSQAQRTLDRLRDVQAATRSVGEALDGISTRERALQVTCDRFVASDAFDGAWAADAPTEGPLAATYVADLTDCGAEVVDREVCRRLAARALREREVRTTTVTTDAGPLAVATIPLAHGDTQYGTVSVARRGETPADERERATLATLGERVAGTLAAIEWKRLLLADSVLELAFEGSDVGSLFATISTELDCTIRVEGVVPLDASSLLFYVTVSGVPPAQAVSTVGDAAASARLIADYSEESLLEVTAEGGSLPGAFIEQGANVTELVVEAGRPRLVCEVAPSTDVRELATAITAQYPTVDLVAKREVERSVNTPMEFQQTLEEQLTSKQRSVLQAAFHSGYFDWPRGSTAEELADSIGVSSPTLHNHLRRGQQKLLAAFFEAGEE